MSQEQTTRLVPLAVTAALLLAAGARPAAADVERRQGYFSQVEGSAALILEDGARQAAESNQPLLSGDVLSTDPGGRLEAVLPDGNLLRVGSDTEIAFDRLAYSADSTDRSTLLRLYRGVLQLAVVDTALGDELPRIDTLNSTIYVGDPGSYLVQVDRRETSVTVRDGYVELRTRDGSSVVRAGEEAVVRGDVAPVVEVYSAGPEVALELWGRELDEQAALADVEDVDASLRYSAAPLARYGTWLTVGGRPAWQPRVTVTWRPYYHGRWYSTPVGLTWLSYEPWGWVPYHYGSWDFAPGFGWVWYPASYYAPAWVYWYWGPSYVGWCPVGTYASFYGYRPWYHFRNRFHGHGHHGGHFGFIGWAGGDVGHFSHWTFVASGRVRDRHLDRHAESWHDLRTRDHVRDLPRGVITAGSAGIEPGKMAPDQILEAFERRQKVALRPVAADVSDFVARQRELSPRVAERIIPRRGEDAEPPVVAHRLFDRGRPSIDPVAHRSPTARGSEASAPQGGTPLRSVAPSRGETTVRRQAVRPDVPSVRRGSNAVRERSAVRPVQPTSPARGTISRPVPELRPRVYTRDGDLYSPPAERRSTVAPRPPRPDLRAVSPRVRSPRAAEPAGRIEAPTRVTPSVPPRSPAAVAPRPLRPATSAPAPRLAPQGPRRTAPRSGSGSLSVRSTSPRPVRPSAAAAPRSAPSRSSAVRRSPAGGSRSPTAIRSSGSRSGRTTATRSRPTSSRSRATSSRGRSSSRRSTAQRSRSSSSRGSGSGRGHRGRDDG